MKPMGLALLGGALGGILGYHSLAIKQKRLA